MFVFLVTPMLHKWLHNRLFRWRSSRTVRSKISPAAMPGGSNAEGMSNESNSVRSVTHLHIPRRSFIRDVNRFDICRRRQNKSGAIVPCIVDDMRKPGPMNASRLNLTFHNFTQASEVGDEIRSCEMLECYADPSPRCPTTIGVVCASDLQAILNQQLTMPLVSNRAGATFSSSATLMQD